MLMTLDTIADISLQNYEKQYRYMIILNQNKLAYDNFWICSIYFFLLALPRIVGLYFTALYRALASSFSRFLDRTQRRATVGRTPLDE
jgi:hypothetical protein